MRTLKKNLYRLEFLQKLHLMKMFGYGNKIAQKKSSLVSGNWPGQNFFVTYLAA